MPLAGRFSRRMRGWAEKYGIPVIHRRAGERKHEIGEQYLPTDPTVHGDLLCLGQPRPGPHLGRATLRQRRDQPPPQGAVPLRQSLLLSYLGCRLGTSDRPHVGHPPFGAPVILNGHEYVANQATRQGIRFTKEGNCFTDWDNAADLNQLADTLCEACAIGRLEQVLRYWLSQRLCLALDVAEQKKMHCQYAFSIYQVEYSRNLLFRGGRDLETAFQGLIDRTRAQLDLKRVITIFGYKHRPNTRERTNATLVCKS